MSALERLPREVLESPSLGTFKRPADVDLRTWFSGEYGGAGIPDAMLPEFFSRLSHSLTGAIWALPAAVGGKGVSGELRGCSAIRS